jgi:regulator of protease activity HflC (stomatin/prohibitin superfamily)
MDIIADRAAMSPAVEEAVRLAVGEEYFVNIVSVVLTNIDFSDAFESAVEEKMIAEQQQLKSEYENQTKVAKAEAEAKAKIVAAEAQAKANELLEQTLTDKILQEMYINKWNGILPQVVAGEQANLLIPSMNTPAN